MIRFIAIALFLFLYLVLGIPVLGLEWLISRFNKDLSDRQCFRMVQWGFGVILSISGVKVTVIGKENIPDEAVLFVGNHRSYFDILLTCCQCPRITGYVAKKEMLRFPLLRTWMARIYCLFLDRENPREGLKTILTAIEYVKSGISIFIFPEGTRNSGEEGSMLPFHNGSFKIAEKSGCPIVPVSLNNTAAMFENQLPRVRKRHVVIEYGKPIRLTELEKEERRRISEHCQALIQQTISRNRTLVEE